MIDDPPRQNLACQLRLFLLSFSFTNLNNVHVRPSSLPITVYTAEIFPAGFKYEHEISEFEAE